MKSETQSASRPNGKVCSSLRTRLGLFLSVEVLMVLCVVIGLGALVAALADAVVVLPESTRVRAPWVLGALGLVVLVVGVIVVVRLSEVRVARSLERKILSLGTAMTNAVQLARHTPASAVGEVLGLRAVTYGGAKAERLKTWPVARRSVLAFLTAALVTVLLWGVAFTTFREVFDAVLPRFTDPGGDHPPYSALQISVEPCEAEILYGGQCEISATAHGKPVEKLYLVAEDTRGVTRTLMFRRPDRSYFQTLTNLREETRYWVTDGRARRFRRHIRIRYTPRITLLEVKTVYPSYTGLRPRRRKLKGADLQVPMKTELSFRVVSNRPLASGALTLIPILGGETKVIPLLPEHEDGKVVSGDFRASEPVAFSISVKDVDGLVSQERRKGRVTILSDRRSRILVMEPGRHAVATPRVSIPVRVRAEDDYGVKQVLWFRGLNRSIERPSLMKNVTKRGGMATSIEIESAFSLEDLGVRPGDRIEYFFEAVDGFPGGPNVTTSRMFTLRIISLAQYKQILRRMAARRALF